MSGRCHIALGFATGLGALALTTPQPEHGLALLTATVATSKLPDQLEFGVLPHRGPTHWLLAWLFVTAGIGILASMVVQTQPYAGSLYAGALLGYGVAHIAADCCTVSGVPLWGPFSDRDVHLLPRPLRVVTGEWRDHLVALLAVVASVGLLGTLVG